MGLVPRRKLDTGEYAVVHVPPTQNKRATLAYALYCTEMRAYGTEPATWGNVARATRDVYLQMADTALSFRG